MSYVPQKKEKLKKRTKHDFIQSCSVCPVRLNKLTDCQKVYAKELLKKKILKTDKRGFLRPVHSDWDLVFGF
jgi:hypothetical protein